MVCRPSLECIVMLLVATLSVPATSSCLPGTVQRSTDCDATQILKPTAGVVYGHCVAGSSYLTPQDVVIEPVAGEDGHGPIVTHREGGKGYYIDATRELKMCPMQYYCPLNSTSGLYDKKIECKEGEFCNEGATKPLECGALVSCPNGCSRVAGPVGIIVFAFLAILMLILCTYTRIRETSMLKESQHANEEYMGDSLDEFGGKFKFDVKPVAIEFIDMGMEVKGAKPGTPPILQGVTGHFPPASLVALMGPSGCGKTTFMNAILDRAPYGNVTGTVKINGVPNGLAKASNLVGFVPQDDIVHGDLTVFQNLYYHARLRLPAGTSNKDALEHVQHCINVLGLNKIQNKVVGTPEKRGISGGQKKRVNIGLELAAMPSIIFMDEPTSGLDGAATVNLAKCMGLLKTTGLTIICVIHQPRWLVFKEFSHLLLLGEGGQQIFSGRTEFIVPYFRSLGFKPAEGENPADWLIDVCSNLEPRYKENGEIDKEYVCPDGLYKEWREKHKADAASPGSKWHQGDAKMSNIPPLEKRTTLGVCASAYYICGRIFRKTSLQHELMNAAVFCFLGLFDSLGPLIGMAQGSCTASGWNMMAQSLGPSFIFAVFVNMQHRFDYGDEKLMISREINSGVYCTAIWLGRSCKSMIFGAFKVSVYALVLYIFSAPLQRFLPYVVAWVLYGLWWVAFAQFTSLLCRDQITAVMVLLMIPIFEQIFSGSFCAMVMDTDIASGFCPRGGMNGFGFWPGYPFFQMRWVGEIEEYPEYVANFRAVNATTYWYNLPSEEMKHSAQTSCGTSYESSLWIGKGGWGGALGALVWQNIYLRLFSLLLLALMGSATNRWVSDKIARCVGFCTSCCGLFNIIGFSVPRDEGIRIARAPTASKSTVGAPALVGP